MQKNLLNLPGVLAVCAGLGLPLSTAIAQDVTYTNPAPMISSGFGYPVTAVGDDRVLIGVFEPGPPPAGTAYLFSTNGTLLTTFTNPVQSMAAVGTDRVLFGAPSVDVGATNAGVAYLFSVGGVLLATITNPAPVEGDSFGESVAAVGTDRLLIGATYADIGANNAGVAYLFGTNGTLFTTFTNPTPASGERFGITVAALGIDRVLVGALGDNTGASRAGAAYLFSTNGTLLATFTNPTPATADAFGAALAAVGGDRVLIGAAYDDRGTNDAGVAYLFDTNGVLLTTFTNPAPAIGDNFGLCVAAVGADRVLIAAPYDDAGTTDAGTVYVFSTDGDLLHTFPNPTLGWREKFGHAVATVGDDRVLIGAIHDNIGGLYAGAAYLFTLPPFSPGAPSLMIGHDPQLPTVTLSWPVPSGSWVLEYTNALPSEAATSWPQISPPYQTNAGIVSVTLTNGPAIGSHFFRLHKY